MTRLLFTSLLGAALAVTAFAQAPQPMPGNSMAPAKSVPLAAPKPASTGVPSTVVMPTSPTITTQMVQQSCSDSGDSASPRMGMLQRLGVLWSGRACQEPVGRRCDFPGYTNDGYVPQYTCSGESCSSVSCCATDRVARMGSGFGVGRFLQGRGDRSCRSCPTSLVGRMKLWLCWTGATREKERCHVPTPYATPARYYFTDHAEPSYNCGTGACNGAGGCVNNGPGLPGRTGGGLVSRIAAGGGLRDRSRGCHGGEGCSLAGTPFNDTLRYARDEKFRTPPIVVSDESANMSFYLQHYFSQRTPAPAAMPTQDANGIQQAVYQQIQK